jgi:hypothetical protein
MKTFIVVLLFLYFPMGYAVDDEIKYYYTGTVIKNPNVRGSEDNFWTGSGCVVGIQNGLVAVSGELKDGKRIGRWIINAGSIFISDYTQNGRNGLYIELYRDTINIHIMENDKMTKDGAYLVLKQDGLKGIVGNRQDKTP